MWGRIRAAVRQLARWLRRDAAGLPAARARGAAADQPGAGTAAARALIERMPEFAFACRAGTRSYSLFVPPTPSPTPRPLLVMLHGCRQTPEDFATGTQMNAAAERHGMAVAYPAQARSANRTLCWNWYRTIDQARDRGEAAIIAELTLDLIAKRDIDRARVFIAGLSAGGAMVSAVTAAYPEIYAAAGIHSGIAAGIATGVGSAFLAMRLGSGRHDPAGSPNAPKLPATVPLIVFQGDADHTVHPQNARELYARTVAAQAAIVRESPSKAREVVTEHAATDLAYAATQVASIRDGTPDAELWLVHGAGHAWSGADRRGSFADARGPDASEQMLRFFLAHRRNSDA